MGQVILGPCAPCAATLAVLIMSFMVSCVMGTCKTPRPSLRVYLGFSICSLVFFLFFRFLSLILFGTISSLIAKSVLWYLKLLLMSDGGKEQEKNLSVLVQEWDIPRKKRKFPFGS